MMFICLCHCVQVVVEGLGCFLRKKVCMDFTHLGGETIVFFGCQSNSCKSETAALNHEIACFTLPQVLLQVGVCLSCVNLSAYYAHLISLLKAGVNTCTTGQLGKDDPQSTSEHVRVSQP